MSTAWSINFNVICATQIMSGTQPDTCTNALASINILQLEDTWKTMAYRSQKIKRETANLSGWILERQPLKQSSFDLHFLKTKNCLSFKQCQKIG